MQKRLNLFATFSQDKIVNSSLLIVNCYLLLKS